MKNIPNEILKIHLAFSDPSFVWIILLFIQTTIQFEYRGKYVSIQGK